MWCVVFWCVHLEEYAVSIFNPDGGIMFPQNGNHLQVRSATAIKTNINIYIKCFFYEFNAWV